MTSHSGSNSNNEGQQVLPSSSNLVAGQEKKHSLSEETTIHLEKGSESLPAPIKLAVEKYINDCLYGF